MYFILLIQTYVFKQANKYEHSANIINTEWIYSHYTPTFASNWVGRFLCG